MSDDSTTPRGGARQFYRAGDTIVFKYEGNVRARVTGLRVWGGSVWVEAEAAEIAFLIPASQVVGLEPREADE